MRGLASLPPDAWVVNGWAWSQEASVQRLLSMPIHGFSQAITSAEPPVYFIHQVHCMRWLWFPPASVLPTWLCDTFCESCQLFNARQESTHLPLSRPRMNSPLKSGRPLHPSAGLHHAGQAERLNAITAQEGVAAEESFESIVLRLVTTLFHSTEERPDHVPTELTCVSTFQLA